MRSCGLVTDIELLDDFPPHYATYVRREHRWIRGDWQILPWLFRHVPAPGGARRNPLPLLERWKIFDNLRRSLVAPALMLLFLLGWTVLPGSPWFWTAAALAVPLLPLIQVAIGTSVSLMRGGSWRLAWLGMRDTLACTAGQALLHIAFLAEQARHALDAVLRTLIRLYVTHRHLLEWETAAATERRLGTRLWDFCRAMAAAPLLAVVAAGVVAVVEPAALTVAGPLLLLWFLSPLISPGG